MQVFLEPVEEAKKCVRELREQGAEVVLCLSHLKYEDKDEICDKALMESVEGIDLLLGGTPSSKFRVSVCASVHS